jgi:rfaE bifunctional protein kinase chain/domain
LIILKVSKMAVLFPMISRERLKELLDAMRSVRIGVAGDACIDVYWEADMTLSRLARENPHFILPVVEERLSPGGGSNAAACLAALGAANVPLLGVIGDDWRGRELVRLLPQHGISADYLVSSTERITTAYCKPLRRGICEAVYEDPHLYFENHAALSAKDEKAVLARFEALVGEVDGLLVADYLECGVVTSRLHEEINKAGARGLPIIVDSRDRISGFRNVILKPNELEALQAVSSPISVHEVTTCQLEQIGRLLAETQESCVCLTMGEEGCIWVEGGEVQRVPTKPAPPPIDIVGAGDCFAAAFIAARAARASGPEASALANLAAGVVVRKIGVTGTASPQEILQRYDEDFSS